MQEVSTLTTASFTATGNGIIEVHAVEFGALTPAVFRMSLPSRVASYACFRTTRSAVARRTIFARSSLARFSRRGLTVTLIGTPAFGTAYVQAPNLAWAGVNGYTFSNSTTGTRYLADALAVIYNQWRRRDLITGE